MPRSPKFASPENPARVGYTKISQPVGMSPRAGRSPVAKATKPKAAKSPKRVALDKLGALPGKGARAQDLLRGAGNRRVKL